MHLQVTYQEFGRMLLTAEVWEKVVEAVEEVRQENGMFAANA
jgi:hypothetical protein